MRQGAYQTLVFMITKDRDRAPKGDFDPDQDVDLEIIKEVKRQIAEEFK
jgi:hypothetical protein